MYDTVIIGAGVVGCAIARELSRYRGSVCVIEREEDVCCGTSKANSAIIHAGFDALPGSQKARMNVRGNQMMDALARDLDFPFQRDGSLVVCTKDQDPALLQELLERGSKNGVPDLRILNRDELLALEPNLAEAVSCALFAPTGGIVCPFLMTIAMAENASANGAVFRFNSRVEHVERVGENYRIRLLTSEGETREIEARAVVNAAGVFADTLHNMVSSRPLSITPRRGQYFLLDKSAGSHVRHTIFQLPGKLGKGVLVTPTVHGNLLVGPTAEDIDDREGINTTAAGLDSLALTAARSVRNLPLRQVITSFAGLRAHEAGDDFILGEAEGAPHFYDAAGIESPGLTAAPAIGEYLAHMVASDLNLSPDPSFRGTRKGFLNPSLLTAEERSELIRQQPAYGNIICRCEMISEGEIIDAIHRTPGARSLDGVKRRTRAGMGRCQSGFCSPRVMEILARELGLDISDITKSGPRSLIIEGSNKHI
ncbi:MAG: NAD(P)/FAD-dependent oxidoreductase [Oscillospiraceae bacterium]